MKDPIENFAEFFQEMQGRKPNEQEMNVMLGIFEDVLGEPL